MKMEPRTDPRKKLQKGIDTTRSHANTFNDNGWEEDPRRFYSSFGATGSGPSPMPTPPLPPPAKPPLPGGDLLKKETPRGRVRATMRKTKPCRK